jgi:hypothetical protein
MSFRQSTVCTGRQATMELPRVEVMEEQPAALNESRVTICGAKMGEGDSEGGSHCKKCGKACGILGFICHTLECIFDPFGWLLHKVMHALCDPVCGRKAVTGILCCLDFCIDPAALVEDAAELAGQCASGADACASAANGNIKDAANEAASSAVEVVSN